MHIPNDEAARYIGLLLKSAGVQNLLIDVSHRNVDEANAVGLETYHGDIFSDAIFDEVDMGQFHYFMALTPGTEVNIMSSRRMRAELGSKNSYRIISRHEQEIAMATTPSKNLLFHQRVDFIELTQLVRQKPELKEMLMESDLPAARLYELHPEVIPIFVKGNDNAIAPVSGHHEVYKEGQTLLYFEKK